MCKRNLLHYPTCHHTLPRTHNPLTRCANAPPGLNSLCPDTKDKVRPAPQGFCHACFARLIRALEVVKLRREQQEGQQENREEHEEHDREPGE